MKRALLIIGLTAFLCLTAQAQDSDTIAADKHHEFSISGEIMTRGEWRNGALATTDEDDDEAKFILERSRLYLNYRQRHLEVQITPQHSGVWGTAGGGAFAMREAWAKLNYKGAFAKFGRQTLAYDDERVIGTNDWSMTSAYHDALKLGYEGYGHKVHAVLAYNQNNINMNGGSIYKDGGQIYKTMQMLWYHYDFSPQLGASALFLNTGIQAESTAEINNQQLMGLYAKYKPHSLTLESSFYIQRGTNELGLPIHAWMASAEGNWKIDHRWNANLGYYHLSGDEKYYLIVPNAFGLVLQTDAHAFNLLFASHHQFYGAMDFFYIKAFYGGYSPGLQDLHLGATYSPVSKVTLGAKYHWLGTSIKIEDLSYTLGHEIELSASWNIMKDVKLSAGYSQMTGTETLKALRRNNSNRIQWGWLMLVVSPKFFSTKW
ncbi:MAG: alginate export family protein [Muribaculaceae bacterium]|nr:alginate export family protein [Muribaculaceae bacterium]